MQILNNKPTNLRITKFFLFVLILSTLVACQKDENPTTENAPLDIPEITDINPPSNPDEGDGTVDEAAVGELGRLLFYDPILSGGRDVACATCHHPDFGYADGRALSIGVEGEGLGPDREHLTPDQTGFVIRNSPTIINTAFNGTDENGNYDRALAPMFWDNRVLSLETQALGPIQNFEEMRGHAFGEDVALDSIVNRLLQNTEYRGLFTAAFGEENAVTTENIGSAIATFERFITATDSPFDRYQAGDQAALNAAQIRGMNRFNQIGCDNCHSGPMFSDYQLHTLGVPDNPDINGTDAGADGSYNFRTPTLRNLTETGPYFHNGVGGNLQQTIAFYRTARNFAANNGGPGGGPGGGLNINPNVNRNQIADEVRDLNNFDNNDIQDIIAFLQALNDPDFDREIPTEVPSGLDFRNF